MKKKLIAYKNVYFSPWLSLTFGSLGVIILMLFLSLGFGGIKAIAPSAWLAIPLSVIVWLVVYHLLNRKFARIFSTLIGIISFACWFFLSVGVREFASMVVLSGRQSLNLVGLSGILFLTANFIEYLIAHPNAPKVIVLFLILNVSLVELININTTFRVFYAAWFVVAIISISWLVMYELFTFLYYELTPFVRRIDNK